MARGGYRPGAGRPKKGALAPASSLKAAPKKRAKAAPKLPTGVADLAADAGETPLEYMLRVMRDEDAAPNDRMRMAVAAAPFVHARAGESKPGKKDEELDKARKAGAGKFSSAAPPLALVKKR